MPSFRNESLSLTRRHFSLVRQTVASGLGAALLILSPGLDFYRAYAATVGANGTPVTPGTPAVPVRVVPGHGGTSGSGHNLHSGAPLQTNSMRLQGLPTPGLSVSGLEAPSAPLDGTDAASALVQPTGNAGAAPSALSPLGRGKGEGSPSPLQDKILARTRALESAVAGLKAKPEAGFRALSRLFDGLGQPGVIFAPAGNGIASSNNTDIAPPAQS